MISSVEDAWTFLFNIFSGIDNKHVPIEKIRIKNRFSPWFDRDLVELLHLKNCIAFDGRLGTRILRLTGHRSGK